VRLGGRHAPRRAERTDEVGLRERLTLEDQDWTLRRASKDRLVALVECY
jgi:hypothetical protein